MWEPDYITDEELADYVKTTTLIDGDILSYAVAASSRGIDDYCSGERRRQFGRTDDIEERIYQPSYAKYIKGTKYWVYTTDDYINVSGVSLTVDGEAVTDFITEPRNAPKEGKPYTRIVVPVCGELAMQTIWGWVSVPVTVKQATLLQGSRLFKRRDAPFGVAGSPDSGSEVRLLAKLDPDVQFMLRKFRRKGGSG